MIFDNIIILKMLFIIDIDFKNIYSCNYFLFYVVVILKILKENILVNYRI